MGNTAKKLIGNIAESEWYRIILHISRKTSLDLGSCLKKCFEVEELFYPFQIHLQFILICAA